MVSILINNYKHKIVQVTVTGHANFATIGKDIVCAGVSAIVTGTLNALHEMVVSEITINHKPGLVIIKVNTITNTNQIILQVML